MTKQAFLGSLSCITVDGEEIELGENGFAVIGSGETYDQNLCFAAGDLNDRLENLKNVEGEIVIYDYETDKALESHPFKI